MPKKLLQMGTDEGQRSIQNNDKHLRWSIQPLTISAKRSILDVWQGATYISGVCLQWNLYKADTIGAKVSALQRFFLR